MVDVLKCKYSTMEIYKDIEGYEGYKISNYGNVKSLGNGKSRKEKILKSTKDKYGYLIVCLSKQGKHKLYFIHRLVAQAFLDNADNLPEVNHKDEDKTNNHVTNLEWCTRLYNHNYGTINQRIADALRKQVLCLETSKIYPSLNEVQKQLGFNKGNISSCCNGKTKQAYGFHWKYVS